MYRIAGKFGGELNLAVWRSILQPPNLKSAKISYSHIYIHMAIPYRTTKFKSANILAIALLGSTAKFNARQYFRLYGIIIIMQAQPAKLDTTFQKLYIDKFIEEAQP